MESNIQELLSEESRSKLERMASFPGADIPWSNPLEPYEVLSPSTEKEVALASLIFTAMERAPRERDTIIALAQKCWGKALEAEIIVPSSGFPISQIHVPPALNVLAFNVDNPSESWSRDDVEAAEKLLALLERALTGVEYATSLASNMERGNLMRRMWSNNVLSNGVSSRLHGWLSENGYRGATFDGLPTQEQLLPITLIKWSKRAMAWRGGEIEDPAMEALYQRRSISPMNLMELHLLEEEYNAEWAAAAF